MTGVPASIIASLVLCGCNTALGYAVARWAFQKELNTFLAIVFGSFGVRAILVIAVVWYCLAIINMHQVAFTLSFAISSFVLLMVEILFFHKSYERAKRIVRRPVTDFLKKKYSVFVATTH
jgi:hypothetical protein